MGKTKIKIIDDSQTEDVKKPSRKSVGELSLNAASPRRAEPDEASVSEPAAGEAQDVYVGEPESGTADRAQISPARPQASTQPPKSGTLKLRSRKYQQVVELVERSKNYPLSRAVELAQQVSYTKFPGTIEAHINTTQKALRGLISLPFVSGRKLTILAFGQGAKTAGADIEGDDRTLEGIKDGSFDLDKSRVDLVLATPEWMAKLASVAKILGPKGLMPNPKSGTVTADLQKAIADLQSGKTEYKTEVNGSIIHLQLGKVTQPAPEIAENVRVLYNALGKSRVQRITLSPTMGPGIKVDLTTI